MHPIDAIGIDWTPYWTWMLVSTRLAGLFTILPGIGTNQIPAFARASTGLLIAVALVASGLEAHVPESLIEGGLMVFTEFILGFTLGFIPAMIIGAITVAGQVTTGAIGLGQANMIDLSLGGQVAILARIQSVHLNQIMKK